MSDKTTKTAQEFPLSNPKPKAWSASVAIDNAIAGFLAGAISTIVLHPLDLLKVRLQVIEGNNKNQPKTLSKLIPQVYRKEGLWKGLYRGLTPNFAGSTLSWGLYFFYYSSIKDKIANSSLKENEVRQLSALEHLYASAAAGLLTCLVANPLFVIKTRMFTQKIDDPSKYNGLLDGLRKLYKYEGIAGFYRGIIPAMFGVSHGAIQFMAYEQLKIARKEYHGQSPPSQLVNNVEYIGMAALSKIFAALCTYPYQVVKSRMQTETKYLTKEYNGVGKTINSIYRFEGMGGFYKGLRINIIRVLPGTMITFGAYEFFSTYFKTHAQAN